MTTTTATSTPILTTQQVEAFNRDGFLVLPAVFNDEQVLRMRAEADHILELVINSSLCNRRVSSRLDWRFTGGRQVVRKIQPINDLSLYLAQVSSDERLVGALRQIMDDEPVLMEEKLNYKQPLPEAVSGIPIRAFEDKFPVHNDWAYYRAQNYPQSILSSAISLDPCTEGNGPLRVWPGSHRVHLEHNAMENGLEVQPMLIDHAGGQDVLCPAGSVLLFHALTVHNSRANMTQKPRRLMIYSHYPKAAAMGHDVRNGPARLREAPWERQYFRMRHAGAFKDVFHAPAYEGLPSSSPLWAQGDMAV